MLGEDQLENKLDEIASQFMTIRASGSEINNQQLVCSDWRSCDLFMFWPIAIC